MPRTKSSIPKLDTPDQTVKQGKYWLSNDAAWYGFINVTVTDAERQEFHAWYDEHAGEVNDLLDDLLAEGMKYGCSFDRENECYVATITGALIANSNMRCCVTTRAGTWADVNALCVWKHYILCAANYDDLLTTGRKRSWG